MINRISQSVILVELLIGRSKWSYAAFVGGALDLWKQMELRSICWGCLGPLEANGATLHLLGVPWTFGSKWSYAPFVGGALELWKQMELRSICWGYLGPLEANGATL